MSGNLPTFTAGQGQISARGMNAMVDAINANQNQIFTGSPANNVTTAWAKNSTGNDLDVFDVVGLNGSVQDPTITYEDIAFKKAIVFDAIKPVYTVANYTPSSTDSGNKHGVVLYPAAADQLALVTFSGQCQVQIDIQDAAHEWATVDNDNTSNLISGVTGEHYISYKQADTGIVWCLVWLNAHHHAASHNPQTNLSSGWDLQNQGTVDGSPATGFLGNVIFVTDSYTPGTGETVRELQTDAHGHVVMVGEGGFGSSSSAESGSSNSSSGDSLSSSSFSSDGSGPDFEMGSTRNGTNCGYTQTLNTDFDATYTARLGAAKTGDIEFDITGLNALAAYDITIQMNTDAAPTTAKAPNNEITVNIGTITETVSQVVDPNADGLAFFYHGVATADGAGKIHVICSGLDPDAEPAVEHCILENVKGWLK